MTDYTLYPDLIAKFADKVIGPKGYTVPICPLCEDGGDMIKHESDSLYYCHRTHLR